MRCPRCGNENPEDNRFCGMCGATMLTTEVPAAQTQRAASPVSSSVNTASRRVPEAPRATAAPTSEPERPLSISGPSFLGLNEPAPTPRKNTSLSIDPHASSRNLDYLLTDEEAPRGSGAGKVFLILIALLLAVGFGYLRWKGQGFGWLGSGSKPSATAKNPAPSDADSSPAAPSIIPESQPAPVNQPAGGTASSNSAASNAASDSSSTSTATPATSSSDAKASSPSSPPDDGTSAAAKTDEAGPADASSKPDAEKPAPKPPAARPARAADPVTEAQRYVYGRGVRQDCERGMRLLKPAANQGNPKAMVEMGALYSAGLCTPHDLPTAYRWFAMALRKDPGNEAIQTDLQKLWGEMTQPERQLAIKLTQ